MKNILRTSLLSVFLLVACGASSQAMLEYTFTGQSVGTYTPLVDPVTILSGTFDDITTANIAIPGVMFGYAGKVYDDRQLQMDGLHLAQLLRLRTGYH
jgi:hypothetical protein